MTFESIMPPVKPETTEAREARVALEIERGELQPDGSPWPTVSYPSRCNRCGQPGMLTVRTGRHGSMQTFWCGCGNRWENYTG